MGPRWLFWVLPRAGAKSDLAQRTADGRSPQVTLAAAAPGGVWGRESLPGQLAPALPALRPAEDHQPAGEPDPAPHAGRQPAGPPARDPGEVLLRPLRAGGARQLLLLRTCLAVCARPRGTGPHGGHGEEPAGWGRAGAGQVRARLDGADRARPGLPPRSMAPAPANTIRAASTASSVRTSITTCPGARPRTATATPARVSGSTAAGLGALTQSRWVMGRPGTPRLCPRVPSLDAPRTPPPS